MINCYKFRPIDHFNRHHNYPEIFCLLLDNTIKHVKLAFVLKTILDEQFKPFDYFSSN